MYSCTWEEEEDDDEDGRGERIKAIRGRDFAELGDTSYTEIKGNTSYIHHTEMYTYMYIPGDGE